MIEALTNQHWTLIGFGFFALLFYIAWMRWRDRRWIEKRFGGQNIRSLSFGVICYGCASDPGEVRPSNGYLILLADRLFFRSRNRRLEIDIPGNRIKKVYHDVRHRGEDLHQSLVMVDFINPQNRKDTVAFKVPYPPQWMQAIRVNLSVKS